MKIVVKVKTGSPEERVQQVDNKNFLVWVKEQPVDNRANEAVTRVLGKFFHIPPTTVKIVHGHTDRSKIVDIPLTADSLDPLAEPELL